MFDTHVEVSIESFRSLRGDNIRRILDADEVIGGFD